jgi:outer membrane protein assembly factor BamB
MGTVLRAPRWWMARSALFLSVLLMTAGVGACAAPTARHNGSPTTAAARLRVISIHLGGEVDGLAASSGLTWAYGRDTGILVRVDQRTRALRRFAFDTWRDLPVLIAAGYGSVWLANQHSTHPDLIRLSAQTGKVIARPQLRDSPGPISAVTVAFGSVWILVPDGSFPAGLRVLRLNPATNRVYNVSSDIRFGQLTGHIVSVWPATGRIWITGWQGRIVELNPKTMATHIVRIQSPPGSLVLGGGYAWNLYNNRPKLTMFSLRTGKMLKTFIVPPPSATGNDGATAGTNVVWTFRGSALTLLDPRSGHRIASERVSPLASEPNSGALIAAGALWYLAQTAHGTALDQVALSQ